MNAISQQPVSIPPDQEWWTESLFGWQARALAAEAEVVALRKELENQRQRNADQAELLIANSVSA